MEAAGLDRVFAALADPTRRAMLARLADGEATVNELAAPFALSQPAVSKHLKVLEAAGLVTRGRNAQTRPARLAPGALAEAARWIGGYRPRRQCARKRKDARRKRNQTGRRRRRWHSAGRWICAARRRCERAHY